MRSPNKIVSCCVLVPIFNLSWWRTHSRIGGTHRVVGTPLSSVIWPLYIIHSSYSKAKQKSIHLTRLISYFVYHSQTLADVQSQNYTHYYVNCTLICVFLKLCYLYVNIVYWLKSSTELRKLSVNKNVYENICNARNRNNLMKIDECNSINSKRQRN